MTFDLQKEFATDEKSELEGIWEDVGGGAKVLVARVGNKEYTERFRRIGKGLQRQLDRGTLPEDKQAAILISIIADTILLDWKGFADEGKLLPYSKEDAKTMLKKYPDFRQFVWDIANDAENYRVKNREDDLGNSSAPSSSASSTPKKP